MDLSASGLRGLIFDKDGTLFDFQKSWGPFTARMIETEMGGDPARMEEMARVMGFDLAQSVFERHSIVIAETAEVVGAHVLPLLPEAERDGFVARMDAATATAPQVPVVPLRPFLDRLTAGGYRLGVATNDSEAPARAHLARHDAIAPFAFIAGYDSGHGGKPAPGQLLAFVAATGLPPGEIAMIGDSTHDLAAGRAAGMMCVGVLTGPAERDELAPHADVVLDSIADLPGWLGL